MENRDRRLIGKQLGTCVLEQLLGAGGMGTVYLAQQQRPTRTVAIKVLQTDEMASINERQEFLTRFRREADVIAQLDHVNILPIYEYGEQDGLAYLVMPYLTGGSLRDLLARQGPLSLTVALSYIEQVAAALQYAHEHRIVHRDIKPANILFHSDGRLVLADFGIARIIRDPNEPIEATLTGPSHFIGSVDYMSPEMVNGTPVDHRTDIYELGIVLFQMLAGRVPFQGTTPFIIAAQHLREQPPSLSLLKPGIPPAVDAVVHKALAKEPDARYDSAQEMAQALRAAITPSGYGVARENTYTTQPMPPSHTTYTAPQRSYDSAYETLPAGYSEVRVPHARTAGSTPQAYQHTASYGWSVDEQQQVAQPAASSPSDTGNPRWPIWIITLCLVVFIGGGLLLALPTLKGLLGISGHPLLPTATAQVSVGTTATPTPQGPAQAQSVVQSYYDAINRADYQSAYLLWGTRYQSAHPYNQFASGFAHTVHDTITLKATTQQTDGTYNVAITLVAVNKTSAGTTTTTYSGSYTVGLENGSMKLLDANFQQTS